MLLDQLPEPYTLENLGEQLVSIRAALGYTQEQLDKLFDLAPKTVQRYEANRYQQCTLRRLTKFYTIAYDELIKQQKAGKKHVDNTKTMGG